MRVGWRGEGPTGWGTEAEEGEDRGSHRHLPPLPLSCHSRPPWSFCSPSFLSQGWDSPVLSFLPGLGGLRCSREKWGYREPCSVRAQPGPSCER